MDELVTYGTKAAEQTVKLGTIFSFGLGVVFVVLAIAWKFHFAEKMKNKWWGYDDGYVKVIALMLTACAVISIISGIAWLLYPEAMLMWSLIPTE